ncbi:MAG: glutathione peroxidase [Planctomycetes bacterium]|nr:glutathione peroxidase [Planctomycetota bacterium]
MLKSVVVGMACVSFVAAAMPAGAQEKKVSGVLKFKVKNINGKEVDLSRYKGKVVLIVNVASECGLTPQYKSLQALHEKYAGKGLAILGFPCNDFGKQEPGTEKEIVAFCAKNYGVKFDMFSKVAITGKDKTPLYDFLTSKTTNPKHGGAVKWNFTKFMIGRDGRIVARFEPAIDPDSDEFQQAIRRELEKQ